MQGNWSFILNILLLIGVITAIMRLLKIRQRNNIPSESSEEILPNLGAGENIYFEEVENKEAAPHIHILSEEQKTKIDKKTSNSKSIMIFIQAKERKVLAGYELLQTILAGGLRFGEGHLFHRHQRPNGQGPILCSLAAATTSGIFDLQNIGAFSVRGLCLFMHLSNNSTIDTERFTIMLETAKQLSADLDAHLLDEKQRPLTATSIKHYCQKLHIDYTQFSNEKALC